MLKLLRKFPGAKTVRNRFLLSQGKLCFAKIVLGAAELPLRIEVGGAAAPPSLPGVFVLVKQLPQVRWYLFGRLLFSIGDKQKVPFPAVDKL